eukprot:2353448-Alexandrium_andersonii.AAC.1
MSASLVGSEMCIRDRSNDAPLLRAGATARWGHRWERGLDTGGTGPATGAGSGRSGHRLVRGP